MNHWRLSCPVGADVFVLALNSQNEFPLLRAEWQYTKYDFYLVLKHYSNKSLSPKILVVFFSDETNIPSLKALLKQITNRAVKVLRSAKQDVKKYEVCTAFSGYN